jgi:hypothetical protein
MRRTREQKVGHHEPVMYMNQQGSGFRSFLPPSLPDENNNKK